MKSTRRTARASRGTRRTHRRGGNPNKDRPVLPPIRKTPSASLARSELVPGSPESYSPVEAYNPSPMSSPSTGSRQEKFEKDLRLASRGKGRKTRRNSRRRL